jgi:hypothetical protein
VGMRCIGLSIAVMMALAVPAAAQQSIGDILRSAGFIERSADTPAKQKLLDALPNGKFAVRKTKTGTRYYVYAEPIFCVCAYVGTQQAMDAYRRIWDQQRASADQPLPPVSGPPTNWVDYNLLHDMQDDDMENEFNDAMFGPDLAPG